MGLIEILLVAVGLSMDAFAVSVCKGLSATEIKKKDMFWAGLWFGGFQGLMPFIGYLLGTGFESFIDSFDHWVAFILLTLIGSNMIREAFAKDEEEVSGKTDCLTMLVLAVATSIDALAVGVSFAFVGVSLIRTQSSFINVVTACLVICLTTFAISGVGVKIGGVFGTKYKSRAEIAGGVILIGIGLKILIQGLV